jgi:hypothetical protein
VESVPARERGAHVEIGEPTVAILSGEKRLRLARDQLEHLVHE